MKYKLETSKALGKREAKKGTLGAGVKRFLPLMKPETGLIVVALVAMLIEYRRRLSSGQSSSDGASIPTSA